MMIINATTFSNFTRQTAELEASDFASVVHNLILDVRDSYRPELHYMRGPGPNGAQAASADLRSARAASSFEYVRRRHAASPTR